MSSLVGLRIQPAPLIIEDAWAHLSNFVLKDLSYKYDAYIASGGSPPNCIAESDIVAINTSMRARCPHGVWRPHIDAGELEELAVIDPVWDLVTMDEADWEAHDIPRLVRALFSRVVGPGIGISRATKVLHIKRPALIPVCDAYVLQLLGIPGESSDAGVDAVVHLRGEGRRIVGQLQALQARLRVELGKERSLVRILDVLIWGSHPDTWLARERPAKPSAEPAAD